MANSNFTCVLDAWRDGTTLYGRMHYYRSGTFTYQDSSFPNPTMNLGGTVYTDSAFGDRVRGGIQVGDVYSTTYSRTVGGTGTRTVTWTAGSGQRSDFAGTWSVDVGGFPGTTSPPTGLNVTNITPGQNSFTATVSISSWGTGSGTKYRELQAWTQGMVEPRRYQAQTGDSLSSSITVNNNSAGSLNIMPNTWYTIGGYASNGSQSVGSTGFGNHVTLPPSSTITPLYITDTAAVIMYSIHDQGGAKVMTVKSQLDSGTAEPVATVTGSGAKSGTFVITGLAPGSTHTLTAEVSTDVGGVVSNTITFTTEVHSNITNPFSLYGAVSGATRRIVKLYGSQAGKNMCQHRASASSSGQSTVGTNASYVMNGTSTSEGARYIVASATLPAGTYTVSNEYLSGTYSTSGGYPSMWVYIDNTWDRPTTTNIGVSSSRPFISETFTLTETTTLNIMVYERLNSVMTNLTGRIMIQSGDHYDSFEQYKGPATSVAIDKLYGSVNGKTKLVFGGC